MKFHTRWTEANALISQAMGLATVFLCGVAAEAVAATVTPVSGPFVGGNEVLVTNATPDIGNGLDITNIVLDGVGTTNILGQGADWVHFAAPFVGSTGAQDIVIQSTSLGDTTLPQSYTINPAGVIPPEVHSGLQRTNLLSRKWLNGVRGVTLAGAYSPGMSGWSVNSAGDVNGDGWPDILVGAHGVPSSGMGLAGETYLVYGRSNGLPALITLTNTWFDGTNGVLFAGANQGDESGASVSSAGDVNGDGYSDILIGALTANPAGRWQAGETYLVFGRSNGLPEQIKLTNTWFNGTNGVLFAGPRSGGWCGRYVAAAGDVNGDGYGDILIGADSYGSGSAPGEAYLIFGRSNGFPAQITLNSAWLNGSNGVTLAGAVNGILCGWAVNPAGDVNGDGFADILIGAPKASPFGRDNAGEGYLVYGRSNGFPALVTLNTNWLDGTNGVLFMGARTYSQIGWTFNSAGDINRDGYNEILVRGVIENEAYLIYGSSNRLSALITLTNTWFDGTNGVVLASANGSDTFGWSVSSAGDVNGDGLPDLLVGAPWASPSERWLAGETYVVYGQTDALPARITMTKTWVDGTNAVCLAGPEMYGRSGCSVRPAGDINRDGYDDFLIGACYAKPSGLDSAGETYLVYGGKLFDAEFVIPSSGPFTGGFQVSINGSNLCNGFDITNVTLCGVAVTGIVSQSANQVVVWAGYSDHVGPGEVHVFSTSFGETMQSNAFTYNGSWIQIQGANFGRLALGTAGTNFLTVTNAGTDDLLITAATNDGPGSAYFDVSSLAGKIVSPETSSNFPVVFTAGGIGTFVPTCYVANNSPTPSYSFGITGSVFQFSTNNGPYAGGNTITISNGHFGAITNVLISGASASIVSSGDNWVSFLLPAAESPGTKNVIIQTSDQGEIPFPDAYSYNPAGQIIKKGYVGWTSLKAGLNNSVSALKSDTNGMLYAGGEFTFAGDVEANYIAKWDPATEEWASLGSGMDGSVSALALDPSGYLYAGGWFTTAGGAPANFIAKWDPATEEWSALGDGLESGVYALTCDTNGNLYATGEFTTAAGMTAVYIAKWDPVAAAWTNLGDGLDWPACALTFDSSGALYVGGNFGTAGGVSANFIAKWDPASEAWSALGSGMDSSVNALAFGTNGNLYAGGWFTVAGGNPAYNIAQWDSSSWTPLGSGMDSSVSALVCDTNGFLYAGGWFTAAGGTPAYYVATWNGTTWTNMGDGMGNGLSALTLNTRGDPYAGGYFQTADGQTVNYAAEWIRLSDSSGVSPSSGSWTGGYEVVISGVNLGDGADVTHVTLCGVAASIQSQSSTQVVVWAGSSANSATGDVLVFSTSYGITTRGDAFAYTGAPTRLELGEFVLRQVNGQMEVCWQTVSEEDVEGFDLFRWTGESWFKVNAELIPAQNQPGARYCVADSMANMNETFRYRLVEYGIGGSEQDYGPADVSAINPHLESIEVTPEGVVISWMTREQNTYEVQRTADEISPHLPIATGIPATPPVNIYTDRMETSGTEFYRIRVE